jgi:hypothetical protein
MARVTPAQLRRRNTRLLPAFWLLRASLLMQVSRIGRNGFFGETALLRSDMRKVSLSTMNSIGGGHCTRPLIIPLHHPDWRCVAGRCMFCGRYLPPAGGRLSCLRPLPNCRRCRCRHRRRARCCCRGPAIDLTLCAGVICGGGRAGEGAVVEPHGHGGPPWQAQGCIGGGDGQRGEHLYLSRCNTCCLVCASSAIVARMFHLFPVLQQ